MINLIVAVGKNGVIGKNGKIPWHLPLDLKRFKALTMGHVLVMGRKTYESIGRPLPGRVTVVLSRKNAGAPSFKETLEATVAGWPALVDKGFQVRGGEVELKPNHEVFICGGAAVYEEALRLGIVDRMYVTKVNYDGPGDVYFPKLDQFGGLWAISSERSPDNDCEFVTYNKIGV
jgi:dihydrofolate reductase